MLLAADLVEWDALLKVVMFSLVGTVGVTAVFSLGIAGASGFMESRREGHRFAAMAFGVLACIAFAAAAAAVAFGIIVMTSKD